MNNNIVGFYSLIRERYGEETILLLRNWQSTSKKLAHYENHKKFLLTCKNQNVFPRHIQNSVYSNLLLDSNNHFADRCHKTIYTFKEKILKLEISFIHWKINCLRGHSLEVMSKLRDRLPEEFFNNLRNQTDRDYKCIFAKTKKCQINKFNNLKCSQLNINQINEINKEWFINLTNVNFPVNVEYLLSLGKKFNLPFTKKNFPLKQLIIDVEFILSSCQNDDVANLLRNSAVNLITNFINSNERSKNSNNDPMLKYSKETQQFLRNHDEIIITRSDKSKATVAMSKQTYISKATELLNDTTTYRKLPTDPTQKIQNKLNKILQQLHKNKKIDDNTLKYLRCSNGVCPKLYFLPKTHKPDCPLRPIVSYVGSPLYNLSKFIGKLLTYAYEVDERHVRNSFELVEQLKNISLPDNYILVSLDAISLFTNIPLELAKTVIKKRWPMIEPHTSLALDEFLLLFDFCTDNSFFIFNDEYYTQTYGLGMGNCLAPVVSDIVMSELQNTALQKLSFVIPFYKRYVDDICTSIPLGKEKEILEVFNNFHPRLVFTIELESPDNNLAFLDVLLFRRQNEIVTDWYQKVLCILLSLG